MKVLGKDLLEVQEFSKEKRKHIKYREGDYFRVKLGRDKYTYGRILLDVYKGVKNKTLNYWYIFMGKVLIVEIFHILTKRKDVSVEELKGLKTFPSQHIMNSNFYYGDYEIIGHDQLPENIAYPIMYGRSISGIQSNEILFQCGKIHIETQYKKEKHFGDFLNNSIGFTIREDERLIEKCLKEKSNKPYWEEYKCHTEDLRNPKNKETMIKVLKEFNLDNLIKLYVE